MTDLLRSILERTTYRKIDVDLLLDHERPSWVRFDPELGYVPADIVMRDGIDHCWNAYTHESSGQRKMLHYADQPCRINTYGDSFTQCQQVSDGETWQEVLAAHLREPIRNFGSGGYGVYQAYRRARRIEDTDCAAEYIILNLFVDDHIRSLDAARWIRTAWNERERPAEQAYPLHGLPWAHLRFDLARGEWVEKSSLCQDENDLRALCDKEKFATTFKDDTIVRLFLLENGGETDVSEFEALAEALGITVDLRNPAGRAQEAAKLHRHYGFKSTEFLFQERILPWLAQTGKKLLILLTYCQGTLTQFLRGEGRYDQEILDFLQSKNLLLVDMAEKHREEYSTFRGDVDQYISNHYVQAAGAAVFGHYTPKGNHFFAFATKNDLRKQLTPPPPAYRD